VPKGLKLLILIPPFSIILLGVITMKIFNRTNIPEKTAKEAVSLAIHGVPRDDNRGIAVLEVTDSIYHIFMAGYPTIIAKFYDNDVIITLEKDNY